MHNRDREQDRLEAGGAFPPAYKARLAWARQMRAEGTESKFVCDYMFEVVTLMCREYTGFKHDEQLELYDREGFTVLRLVDDDPPDKEAVWKKRPWWAFWRW